MAEAVRGEVDDEVLLEPIAELCPECGGVRKSIDER